MAFDPALPANSTKLRLAPGVIQDNWVAIQEAQTSFKPYAVNLNNRTPLGVANDPAAIADAYIAYCKDDGAGNAELFGINESSQITQLTKGVPTVGATGSTFLPGGVLLKWGTQSVTSGNNVTFASAFGAAPYYVSFIVKGVAPNNRLYQRIQGSPTAALFTPIITDSSGTGVTATINWMAIGV